MSLLLALDNSLDGYIVTGQWISLDYTSGMKFILFLCLSLFVSMLHAAAMPIHDIGDAPMQVESTMTHHMSSHCAKMMQEDPNQNHCCYAAAIQSTSLSSLVSIDPQRLYISLSPRHIRHTPNFVFRPPKSRPV